jgi:hypothetical protein
MSFAIRTLSNNIPVVRSLITFSSDIDLGTAEKPFESVYAGNLVISSLTGGTNFVRFSASSGSVTNFYSSVISTTGINADNGIFNTIVASSEQFLRLPH